MDWPSAIRKFRRRARLKQQALAEMLGCDQTAISHWERGVDRPSLAFQRRLLEMIARDHRAMEDLRLFTAVERSPGVQALIDDDLRILAGSRAFWNLYLHLYGKSHDPDIFREFGNEENKKLARKAFDSAAETVVIEGEITMMFRDRAVRMKGIGTPILLSDNTPVVRIDVQPADSDVDAPLKSQFVGIDDLKDQ